MLKIFNSRFTRLMVCEPRIRLMVLGIFYTLQRIKIVGAKWSAVLWVPKLAAIFVFISIVYLARVKNWPKTKIDRKLIARIACSYACYDILLGRDFDNSLKVENRNRPIVEIDPLSRLTIKIILYEPSLLDHGDSFPQPISQYHNPLVGLPPYRSMDDNSMDFETANVAYIDPTMPWTVKLFEHMFIIIRRDPFVVLMLEYALLLHGRNKATVPPDLLHGPESTTITETFQSWHRYWMIDARWSWSRYFISALPKPMNARCHIICSSFVVILLLLVLVSMVDLMALGTWYLYCPFPEPLGLMKWFDFWNNDHHPTSRLYDLCGAFCYFDRGCWGWVIRRTDC